MTRRLTACALAVLLGATLSCASPTAPAPFLSAFHAAGPLDAGQVPPMRVDVSAPGVTVTGGTATPSPCYALTGEVRVNGSDVVLRVIARDLGSVCVGITGHFSYTAIVGMPAGHYTVAVVHEFPGTGLPATEVLRQTVTVD